MTNLPKRTATTGLSDDVLLLLDFLFDKWSSIQSLQRDVFPFHHNCSYSHSLDDDELQECIKRLMREGILQARVAGGSRSCDVWTLTELGGHLWEKERLPDWTRFLGDSLWQDDERNWTLEVRAPSLTLAQDFVRTATRCNLWGDQLRTPWRQDLIDDHAWIAWRTFPRVHVLTVQVQPHCGSADWRLYNEERTWWRTMAELQRFQPARAAAADDAAVAPRRWPRD